MMAVSQVAPDRWLRPAVPADVPAMAELINGYASQGLMLPKTESALYAAVRDYVVVVDLVGRLAACGGLRVYSGALAEVVGLAVAGPWQGRGLGGDLVDTLVGEARGMGIRRVFAMTLSEPFFARHGFVAVPRSTFPEKERADCDACPRRTGCREVAVQREVALARSEGPVLERPGRGRRRKRPAPVRLPVIGDIHA